VPLSDAAAGALARDRGLLASILGGGDDYELVLAVAERNVAAAEELAARHETRLTAIGRLELGFGVGILDESGRPIELPKAGFQHF
jgi:thiamine-monophosphate kinase